MKHAEERLVHSLQMMHVYANCFDLDGQLALALEIESALPHLANADSLLNGDLIPQLIGLIAQPRHDGQVAGCRTLAAAIGRFPTLGGVWAAARGAPPLVELLASTPAVQAVACAAIEVVAPNGGRAALIAAGAPSRLLHLVGDETPEAQGAAAGAFAQVGCWEEWEARGDGAPPSVPETAIDALVAMASRGSADSRTHAARAIRKLSVQAAPYRRMLVAHGAVEALLDACAYWKPSVVRDATIALAGDPSPPLPIPPSDLSSLPDTHP